MPNQINKVLAIFGDSWAFGAELDESTRKESCFGSQLARMLGMDSVHNFSEPGSGITHLHLQLDMFLDRLKGLERPISVIGVFFISGHERFMIFDSDGEFAHLRSLGAVIRPKQNHLTEQLKSINEYYFKNIHSEKADHLNVNINLSSLQARCRYHGIDDYYIPGWQTLDLWPEIDTQKIYRQGQKTCTDILGIKKSKYGEFEFLGHPYITPNSGHPNVQGHEMIANELYQMISNNLTST